MVRAPGALEAPCDSQNHRGRWLGQVDLSLGDQLRQRAAIGGERERAELAAFEDLLSRGIADALVAQLKEAEVHGVDVLTWLVRDRSKSVTRDGELEAYGRRSLSADVGSAAGRTPSPP